MNGSASPSSAYYFKWNGKVYPLHVTGQALISIYEKTGVEMPEWLADQWELKAYGKARVLHTLYAGPNGPSHAEVIDEIFWPPEESEENEELQKALLDMLYAVMGKKEQDVVADLLAAQEADSKKKTLAKTPSKCTSNFWSIVARWICPWTKPKD